MVTRSVCSVAVVSAALATTISGSAQPAMPRSGATSAQTVAIIRFTNLTGDPGDEWIGDGIAESLATGFPPGSAVIARMPPANPTGAPQIGSGESTIEGAREVGRGLGVSFAVSGAFQRLGDVLRITGQYVDVTTGAVLRSAKVDGALDDLFDLQDRVVAELSGAVEPGAAVASRPRDDQAVPGPPTAPSIATPVAPRVLPPVASSVIAPVGRPESLAPSSPGRPT